MSFGSDFYSVRMRAAVGGPHEAGGRHLSGAERLVPGAEAEAASVALLQRALRLGIPPDFVRITLERVAPEAIERIPCPDVITVLTEDPAAAREAAVRLLAEVGVAEGVARAAFRGLLSGLGPGGRTMRGAALYSARTGKRLEGNPERGVRASHMDYAPEVREAVVETLLRAGLTHPRTMEALVVAAKGLWAGALAEVCWSDDPDYTAGYVATRRHGYVRFPVFKPQGAAGGRVFFVNPAAGRPARFIERLEKRCVLVSGPPRVRPSIPIEALDTLLGDEEP